MVRWFTRGSFHRGCSKASARCTTDRAIWCTRAIFPAERARARGRNMTPSVRRCLQGRFWTATSTTSGISARAPEDIAAAFGSPGYTTTAGGCRILAYLNLGTAFLCADNGEGMYTCDRVLIDIDQSFLEIGRDSTLEELKSCWENALPRSSST